MATNNAFSIYLNNLRGDSNSSVQKQTSSAQEQKPNPFSEYLSGMRYGATKKQQEPAKNNKRELNLKSSSEKQEYDAAKADYDLGKSYWKQKSGQSILGKNYADGQTKGWKEVVARYEAAKAAYMPDDMFTVGKTGKANLDNYKSIADSKESALDEIIKKANSAESEEEYNNYLDEYNRRFDDYEKAANDYNNYAQLLQDYGYDEDTLLKVSGMSDKELQKFRTRALGSETKAQTLLGMKTTGNKLGGLVSDYIGTSAKGTLVKNLAGDNLPYQINDEFIATLADRYNATSDYGLGNIDLNARGIVKNKDGTISTVDSISINEDGKEILIPTVIEGKFGWKKVSNEEAIEHYHKTGQYLGKFDTVKEANAYAQKLHKSQEAKYSNGIPGSGKNNLYNDKEFKAFINSVGITQEEFDAIGDFEKQKLYDSGIKTVEDYNKVLQKQAFNDVANLVNKAGYGSNVNSLQLEQDAISKEFQLATQLTEGDVGKFMYQLLPSMAGMGADAVINYVIPGTGLVNMGLRTYGTSYNDAILKGADEESANYYAFAHAAIEMATEKMFNVGLSYEAYGAGLEALAKKAISNISREGLQKIAHVAVGTAGEAGEELIAEILDPICEAIIQEGDFKSNVEKNFSDKEIKEYLTAALGGAVMSLLGTGAVLTTSGAKAVAGKTKLGQMAGLSAGYVSPFQAQIESLADSKKATENVKANELAKKAQELADKYLEDGKAQNKSVAKRMANKELGIKNNAKVDENVGSFKEELNKVKFERMREQAAVADNGNKFQKENKANAKAISNELGKIIGNKVTRAISRDAYKAYASNAIANAEVGQMLTTEVGEVIGELVYKDQYNGVIIKMSDGTDCIIPYGYLDINSVAYSAFKNHASFSSDVNNNANLGENNIANNTKEEVDENNYKKETEDWLNDNNVELYNFASVNNDGTITIVTKEGNKQQTVSKEEYKSLIDNKLKSDIDNIYTGDYTIINPVLVEYLKTRQNSEIIEKKKEIENEIIALRNSEEDINEAEDKVISFISSSIALDKNQSDLLKELLDETTSESQIIAFLDAFTAVMADEEYDYLFEYLDDAENLLSIISNKLIEITDYSIIDEKFKILNNVIDDIANSLSENNLKELPFDAEITIDTSKAENILSSIDDETLNNIVGELDDGYLINSKENKESNLIYSLIVDEYDRRFKNGKQITSGDDTAKNGGSNRESEGNSEEQKFGDGENKEKIEYKFDEESSSKINSSISELDSRKTFATDIDTSEENKNLSDHEKALIEAVKDDYDGISIKLSSISDGDLSAVIDLANFYEENGNNKDASKRSIWYSEEAKDNLLRAKDAIEYYQQSMANGGISESTRAEMEGYVNSTVARAVQSVNNELLYIDNAQRDRIRFAESISKNKKIHGKIKGLYLRSQISAGNVFRMLDGFRKWENGIGYQYQSRIDDATANYTNTKTRAMYFFQKVADAEDFVDFAENKTLKDGNGNAIKLGNIELGIQDALTILEEEKTMKTMGDERFDKINGFYVAGEEGKGVFVEIVNKKSTKDGVVSEDHIEITAKELKSSMTAMKAAIKSSQAAIEYSRAMNSMFAYYSPLMQNTYKDVNGYDKSMYKDGVYFPIRYKSINGPDPDYSPAKDTFDERNVGFMKSRTRTSGGYVVVKPASVIVENYSNGASDFIAYGRLGKELALLNQKNNPLNNSIAKTAGEMYGDNMRLWMDNYVDTIANVQRDKNEYTDEHKLSSAVQNTSKALRSTLAQGALLGSISVPMKQVSSYWAEMGVLSPESVIGAYKLKVAPASEQAKKNVGVQSRRMGNIDPTTADILTNEKSWVGKMRNRSKAFKWATNTISIMDYHTVANAYDACVLEIDSMIAGSSIKRGSAKYIDMVDNKFQEVLLNTQPIYNTKARAEMFRTDDEFVKLFTMFKTQQNQNFNRLVTAIGEFRAAKGTSLEDSYRKTLNQTVAAQATSALSLSILQVASDIVLHKLRKYRDDDDDEISAAKIFERIGINAVESLGATTWMGDAVAQLIIDGITAYLNKATDGAIEKTNEFYGISAGPFSTIFGEYGVINNFAKILQRPTATNIKQFVTSTSTLIGVPIGNVYRFVNSMLMYTLQAAGEDLADYDDIFTYIDNEIWARENNSYGTNANILVNSYLEGNNDKVNKILSFIPEDKMDSFTSQVVSNAKDRFLSGDSRLGDENQLFRILGKKDKDIEETEAKWQYEKDTYGLKLDNAKADFISGKINYLDAYTALTEYKGLSDAEATEKLAEWQIELDYGTAYDESRNAYIEGEIDRNKYKEILEAHYADEVLDMSDTIDLKLKAADYQIAHPDINPENISKDFKGDKITDYDVIDVRQEVYGDTKEEAFEYLHEKQFEKEYDVEYSEMGKLFRQGKISPEKAKYWRVYCGSSEDAADAWVLNQQIGKETGYNAKTSFDMSYYDTWAAKAKEGSNTFYTKHINEFRAKEDFGRIFNALNEPKNFATGSYISPYSGESLSATQTGVIDILNENLANGSITPALAKAIWQDYFGYSTGRYSGWKYVNA